MFHLVCYGLQSYPILQSQVFRVDEDWKLSHPVSNFEMQNQTLKLKFKIGIESHIEARVVSLDPVLTQS